MSVIIVGMNMPQCCMDCPIYDNEFGQCNLIPDSRSYNKDPGEELYDPFEERHEGCPLRGIG